MSHPDNRCYSVRLRGRFSVPTCRTAPRRAQKAVKAGRRPPPQAAPCGLDGREHGATLYQVGSARFLADTPSRRGGLPTCCLRGYRPLLFLLATMVGSPITQLSRSRRVSRTAGMGQEEPSTARRRSGREGWIADLRSELLRRQGCAVDWDRGTPRDATPPPPPGIRVRTTAVRLGKAGAETWSRGRPSESK